MPSLPPLPVVLATALLTGGALAQLPLQALGFDPGASDLTSRSGLRGDHRGAVLLQMPGPALAGVGNPTGSIVGLTLVLQDQDRGTPDAWRCVVLRDDGRGAPDITPAGELFRSVELRSPVAVGPGAGRVSVTFSTPVAVPTGATFYLGVELPPNGDWPADGLSVHAAEYALSANVTNPAAPRLTFTHDRTAGTLVVRGLDRAHRIEALVTGPTLSAGADVDPALRHGEPNPNFGIRGAFPDRAAGDGLAFRVRDGGAVGQQFAILGQLLGANPAPFRLPGLGGLVFLTPGLVFPDLLGAGTLDAQGEAIAVYAGYPFTLGASGFGVISVQAITGLFGNERLSNLAVIDDR
ncbi:MAG: hypothetical protein IPM29_02985 [Planctomycetes bacterium]|nr:hypothetical protein [Planctomycetota bacterium]